MSLHTTSIITTPVHCFGLYCLLWRTPESMKSVKWYLVNLHLWIMMFDYTYGLLVIPYILVPYLAGYPLGILQYFEIPTEYQLMLLLLGITYVVDSIVAVFENRFHVICVYPGKEYWNCLRRWWLAFHYMVSLLIIGSLWFLFPNQEIARKHVFEGLPCIRNYISESQIFVATENVFLLAVICAVGASIVCCECISFAGYLVFYTLRQFKMRQMSRKSFLIQRRFLMALVVQMEVPFFTLVFPTIYAWTSVFTSYHNQTLINIALTIGSLHGVCSTIVMLYVHHPYREIVLSLFLETKMMRLMDKGSSVQRGYLNNLCLRC